MDNCKLCGDPTPIVFNIKLKKTPVCEECANALTHQQVAYLTTTLQRELEKVRAI